MEIIWNDPVQKRFEDYLFKSVSTDRPETAEDILVNLMVMQEFVKHMHHDLNFENALHRYNEVMYKILGRGENNGQS